MQRLVYFQNQLEMNHVKMITLLIDYYKSVTFKILNRSFCIFELD